MTRLNITRARAALDTVIRKSRVHLYKPIQIAEILYHARTDSGGLDLADLEAYRNPSKRWRDEISRELLGRVCTSSQKFQDNIFDANATPPEVLVALSKENISKRGAVEAYIYRQFTTKHTQLSAALAYCLNANKSDFDVSAFIASFWREPGLKRSIDKIYEIIVFALFTTLVTALELQVQVSIAPEKKQILEEFADFAKSVMCLEQDNIIYIRNARVYRVGVTNAADRGLDMYSNWGPAIQIKHLSLDETLAENIVSSITSDQIVIVCKNAEKNTILSLLTQLGWRNRIQGIVTEANLSEWYGKALRGKFEKTMGDELLACLCEEIANEFPAVNDIPEALKEREYDKIVDEYWQ